MQYLKINSELVALGTTEVNLDNYVQKEEGKSLSDNNYTDEDKLKVTSIPSDIASTVESLSTEVESLNGDVADVQSDVGAVGEKIGDLSTLKTIEKSNLVGAVNEINDSLVDIESELGKLIKSNVEGKKGYIELPNKICIEWGVANIPLNSGINGSVNVKLSKITNFLNVQATPAIRAGVYSNFYLLTDGKTSDFSIIQAVNLSQTVTYNWVAIGTCD